MQKNLISESISPADLQNILTSLAQAKKMLAPILIFNLTSDQRHGMLKMGDKTLAFVENSMNYANTNPDIVPAFLDVDEANKDYALARDLYTIFQQISTLARGVEDTMMLAGGEAYDAALIFYAAVKGAVHSNVAGSEAIYEDLRQRFPRTKKAKVTPVNPVKKID